METEDLYPINPITRIERIEKILRDHQFHEPECPIRKQQTANKQGRMYYLPSGECNCWLSNRR